MTRSRAEFLPEDRPVWGISRHEVAFLALSVVVALLVRLYFFRFHTGLEGDGVHYAELARNIVRGTLWDGFYAYRASLYQAMVAGTALLTKLEVEISGRLVSAFWGSLLTIPVYFLGRALGGRAVGVIAVALVIVHQALISYSVMLFTEPTYMFFLYAGLLLVWVLIARPNRLIALAAGVLIGIASLVRTEGVVYFLGVFTMLVTVAFFRRNTAGLRLSVSSVLVFAVAFLAIAGSASFWMWSKTGETPFASKSTVNLLIGEDVGEYDVQKASQRLLSLSPDAATLAFPDEVDNTSFVAYLASHPLQLLGRAYRNFGLLDRQVLILALRPSDLSGATIAFFALVTLGLFGAPWRRPTIGIHLYLLLIVLIGIASYVLFFFHVRLILPVLPVFILWASQGVVNFAQWATISWRAWPSGESAERLALPSVDRRSLLLGLAVSLLMLFNNLRTAEYYVDPLTQAYKSAGLWLKAHLPPQQVLMADNPFAPYYYDSGEYVVLPYAEWQATVDFARKNQVQYILVTQATATGADYPQAGAFFSGSFPPEIELVAEFPVSSAGVIRVFKLLPETEGGESSGQGQ